MVTGQRPEISTDGLALDRYTQPLAGARGMRSPSPATA
jgi:hypothetical protein